MQVNFITRIMGIILATGFTFGCDTVVESDTVNKSARSKTSGKSEKMALSCSQEFKDKENDLSSTLCFAIPKESNAEEMCQDDFKPMKEACSTLNPGKEVCTVTAEGVSIDVLFSGDATDIISQAFCKEVSGTLKINEDQSTDQEVNNSDSDNNSNPANTTTPTDETKGTDTNLELVGKSCRMPVETDSGASTACFQIPDDVFPAAMCNDKWTINEEESCSTLELSEFTCQVSINGTSADLLFAGAAPKAAADSVCAGWGAEVKTHTQAAADENASKTVQADGSVDIEYAVIGFGAREGGEDYDTTLNANLEGEIKGTEFDFTMKLDGQFKGTVQGIDTLDFTCSNAEASFKLDAEKKVTSSQMLSGSCTFSGLDGNGPFVGATEGNLYIAFFKSGNIYFDYFKDGEKFSITFFAK